MIVMFSIDLCMPRNARNVYIIFVRDIYDLER